jgi:spermidine/putrescine transport system permease protein
VNGASATPARYAWLALIPAAAWLTLFFLIPLMIVAAISLMRTGAPIEWKWDASGYVRLLDPLHLTILFRSFGLALLSTSFCLVLGYPLAYFIVQRSPRVRRFLYFMVLAPLWANSLVLIYAWMVLLRPNGVFDQLLHWVGMAGDAPVSLLYTPVAVLLGLVYWYLPFMVYPLYVSLEKFDFTLLDAARDLGASRFEAFRRVLWPLTLPGIAVGSLLVFIQSLSAFIVPDLLGGAKSMMLGNLIQQRFLSVPQDWPLGAAVTMALLAIVGGGLVFYFRLQKHET